MFSHSINSWLPVAILLVAFATAIVMLLTKEKNESLRTVINLSSAAINVVLIAIMLAGIAKGQVFESTLPLLPDIKLVFDADPLSMMFVSLSGILWFFTTLYAVGYFRHGKHRSRFFGFFSLCVFSTLGIAMAGNLITFLIFYELLTLATYPLIVHKGNEASLQSGKVYLTYTMIGGAVFMVGVVWLKSLVGTLDFTTAGTLASMTELGSATLTIIFLFLLIGLGVKAALFPLHGWLPRAMAAPAPVSSLLHAVAVVKAGAFGIIRVVHDVYGIELAQSLGVLQVLVVFASFTIIYGSVRAIYQNDIKKRLAFSTVSQVSYITLGIAMAGPIAAVGATAHLVHQGLMKITMFFCAGNLAESQHIYKVTELNGVAKKMPVTMTTFTLAVFGMIGIPPLAGFVSKWYLGVGAIGSGYPWVIAILAGSSLLNAIYFLPLLYRAWFLPVEESAESQSTEHKSEEQQHNKALEAHWMMLVPPVVSITVALKAGLFAQSEYSPLSWSKLIVSGDMPGGLPQFTQSLLSFDSSHLLGLVILLPIFAAMLIWLFPGKQLFKFLLPVVALPAIYLGLQPASLAQEYSSLFFGAHLVADPMAKGYLILSGVLWCLASLYSCFYYGLGDNRKQFFSLFAIAMASSFGLILSADMYGFLTFFTCMSLASYVLIIRGGKPDAKKAANLYIKWVIVGEVAIFSAFCVLNYLNLEGSSVPAELVQFMALMMVAGFGIKIGLLGFHGWLPLAHPVAVVPASAMLSGFMVKAGMIGWMKFFPFELPDVVFQEIFYNVGLTTVILGIVGTFYAALTGITKTNPKEVLAWSTISQMGILSASFGFLLMFPDTKAIMIPVIVFYSIHHGLAKSALFLSVGTGNLLNRQHYPSTLLRIAVYAVLLIPALSLVGAPLLSGYFAKSELKLILIQLPWLKTAVTLSSVFTGLLMCRFAHQLRRQALQSEQGHSKIATDISHSFTKYAPLFAITGVNSLLVLLVPLYLSYLVLGEVASFATLTMENLLMAFLPVVVSIIVYWFANRFLPEDKKHFSAESNNRLSNVLYRPLIATSLRVLQTETGVEPKTTDQKSLGMMPHWLQTGDHVSKTMNSPSVAVLLMLICLLLLLAFYQ